MKDKATFMVSDFPNHSSHSNSDISSQHSFLVEQSQGYKPFARKLAFSVVRVVRVPCIDSGKQFFQSAC